MKISFHSWSVTLCLSLKLFVQKLLIIFIIAISANSYLLAQGPDGERLKEKIEQVKKMKLLEVLDLDETTADKFLVKFNAMEKKISELQKSIDDVSYKLKNRIQEKAGADELSKSSSELLSLMEQLQNTQIEKLKAMKGILKDEQYAKYLVFENEFPKELRRHIMKRFGGNGPGSDGPRKRNIE